MNREWLNVGCGPFRAPEPWVNLDVVDNDNTHPDIVVSAHRPLGLFSTETIERVYLGHILEHVPWDEVPRFLSDVMRALRPGGEIAVVGPDVERAIHLWHGGVVGWDIVTASLEHESPQYDLGAWPEARHWWNCTEARVVGALTLGGFVDVLPQSVTAEALNGWPVVAFTQHQCAVTARKAST